jgi:hypothetical protein
MIDRQYSSYCFLASELSIEKNKIYSRQAAITFFFPVLVKGFYQTESYSLHVNKGNNKITELRTILERESQNS